MVIRPLDVAVAGALVCLGIVQLVSSPPEHVQTAALLTVAMTMPMLARRLRPHTVTLVVAVAVGTYSVLVEPEPPFCGFVALLVASYTLTRERTPRSAAIGYVPIAAAVAVTGITQPTATLDWLYPLVYLGGGAAVGWLARRRSSQQALETVQKVKLALGEERSRISRELHDVVAHGLGVMVLHAEAADELLDADREAAHSSLSRIQEAGREAVGELSLMLDLLRDSDDADELSPQPMLDQLPALVADLDTPGRAIALVTSGDLAGLPTGLQLTVFRVVQEALTNVARHSRADQVRIRIDRDTQQLFVDVLDSGPRSTRSPGSGHGLIGMRERARLYGGSLEAGPEGAGFRVRLSVPSP